MSASPTRPARPGPAAWLLFVAALLPRLPGLGIFLTSDERTNIFSAGSDVRAAVLHGNLRGTYWHFYPGVTMSWLDALGLGGQYLLQAVAGQAPPLTTYLYGAILSLLVAARLPYALLTAAAVPALYLLARKLLPERVALLGALLLAFDPFYLAHSRVAHGDAPVAVFMALSTLAFFVYLERWPRPAISHRALADPYLIISAVCGSLAALTKTPGPYMALFITGLAALYAGRALWQGAGRAVIGQWLAVVITWGLVALATFILLWPSMWVDPVGTVRQMWLETFGKVNEGHLVYFLGRPTLDPGPWFYSYVTSFRLTPITLVGSLLSLPLLYLARRRPHTRAARLLWLFTLSLLLFGNLSPKKQDRYLLPLFPFLDLLAAVGWLGLLQLLYEYVGPRLARPMPALLSPVVLFLLFGLHSYPVLTYYPYYLAYFNPLLGGPTRAAETTLMGWGEGMEQAAAYLNTRPDAAHLYVASTPSQTLLPYFAGTGENFYTNDIAFRADYVVLYLAQMQRMAPSPEIVRYFQMRQPEATITIKGVTYAKIYPGPRLILPDMPPQASPVNIGLGDLMRLAGYHRPDPATLVLYWHALAPLERDYTISVRAYAAGDRLLAQQDSWPVAGLLPTSQWRQGDYVTDSHALPLTVAEAAQVERFEIVVYHLETGQALGPPISLATPEQP